MIRWFALVGTLLIVIALGIAIMTEPLRRMTALDDLQTRMVVEGIDLYAQNCVACHGVNGEGIASYPPLNMVVEMDPETLYKTIERGRYNTAMAAFGVDEGGILTGMQVQSIVTMLQASDWQTVTLRVAELGLTPPQITVAEIPEEMLAKIEALPDGATLAAGLTVFTENCVACHGANGEGSTLAPPLSTTELRTRLTDADLLRIIDQGVPGTLMASWNQALEETDKQSVITLIRRWEELTAAEIVLPVIEAAPLDSNPETIANGNRLFSLLCTQCHGVNGYGTRIAPALNSQTFLTQTPDAAIQQIITGGVTGTAMPAWGGYLTEADIAAVTAYLRSLEISAPLIAPAQP